MEARASHNMRPDLGLSALPGELQDHIIPYLHPSSAVALRQTNHHFNITASLERLEVKEVRNYLQDCVRRPHNSQNLACYFCLRLRPKTVFAQSPGRSTYRGFHSDRRHRCLDCAVREDALMPGNCIIMANNRDRMLFCIACLTLQGRFCKICRWCSGCAGKRRMTSYWRGEDGYQAFRVYNNCRNHAWNKSSTPELLTPARTKKLYIMQSLAVDNVQMMFGGGAIPETFDELEDI